MAEETQGALVRVFDAEQESEVMVVQGLLESAGIESVLTSLDAPQDIMPVGGVVIQVTANKADEARKLIEDYRASAAAEPAINEEATASEEPTA